MKNITGFKLAALTLGVAMTAGSAWANSELDYSSVPGAAISFNGTGGFSFTPSSSFSVSGTSSLTSAIGLIGGMSGTWNMGAVTTVIPGVEQTAPVTGTGTFFINDGAGHLLTGNLVWDTIEQLGTGSTANYLGQVNLTGLAYTGSNAGLLTLLGQNNIMDTLNFTFVPPMSLSALETTAATTTFSGSITGSTPGAMVPDGGMTLALMGGSFTLLGALRRKLVR